METRMEEKKSEEKISIEEFIGKQKISDDALISFIKKEKIERIQELLENITPTPNINIKMPTEKEMTPLMLAAKYNRTPVLQLLLDKGAHVQARNTNHWTALHYAADSDFPNCVKPLVEAKADINAKDKQNDTPLHLTAYIDNVGAAQELLKHKADPLIKNTYGTSPFLLAAMKNNARVFKVFLNEKTNNLNEKDDINKDTALHWAAKKGNHTIISLLLEAKADPEIKNKAGKTPLAVASTHKSRVLLEEVTPSCFGCFPTKRKSSKAPSEKIIAYTSLPLSK